MAGRELSVVHYDPGSDPARFRALAEKLILDDGVNVIFGGYTSSSRKAMLPVVEKHNRLLVYFPAVRRIRVFREHHL